ncbi:hypothetical protein DFH11DRAFT_1548523 [Phellopilus nigrolimitatus]|nr:hypothetical protein DFH11DRAFT_1732828 [Phellopilus nigrolimitatus]KAH8109229.1 hypothetical protein DFH11DRAFT_1548523 [Phellopilus nigrolimitatus]
MYALSRPTPIPRAPLPRPGQPAAPSPVGLPYTLPFFLVNVAWVGIAQDIGEPQLVPLAIEYAGPRYTAQWRAVPTDPAAPWGSFINGLITLYPEILPALDPQKVLRLQPQIGRLLLEDIGHDAPLTFEGFYWMDDILHAFATRFGLPYRPQDSLSHNFTKIALSAAFRRLRDVENHVGLRNDGPLPPIPGPNLFRDLPPHLVQRPRARLVPALNLQHDPPNNIAVPAPPQRPRAPAISDQVNQAAADDPSQPLIGPAIPDFSILPNFPDLPPAVFNFPPVISFFDDDDDGTSTLHATAE